jgi:hypothetical protein
MTIRQAIDKSIEKWERICFNHEWVRDCALCEYCTDTDWRTTDCRKCPLGQATGDFGCHELWRRTSDGDARKNAGCDADYEMLFTLYMLKIIYPEVTYV